MYSTALFNLGNQPSPIRELFNYGKQREKIVGEENVFDFTLGNPSVPAPEKVTETWLSLLQSQDPVALHSYSVSAGHPTVRQAIAEDLNKRYQTHYGAKDLYITCGAAAALVSVFAALTTSPDSEFMALAPFFPEYRNFVETKGGRFTVAPADPDFRLQLDTIRKMINLHTQAIILNSPNNPGGKVYSRTELEELGELLKERSETYGHPIYIVSDEPYRELVYDGIEVPFIPNIYPNTLVCYSYSKAFSIPGERIGYFLVPPEATDAEQLYKACAGAARTMGYVCAPSLTQKVIEKCASVRPDLKPYEINRKALYQGLTEAGYQCVHPDGAFYLFVKAPGGDGQAFSDRCKEKDILVVPGAGFGCPEYVRISYCVPNERIQKALPLFRDLFQS